jgi:mannonate dehydratase
MHRREFFHTTAGALAAAGAQAQTAQPAAGRKANLKLGTQHGDSDDILKVMAALGVNHICGQLPSAKLDQNWSVEALTRRREHVESFGLKLEAVPLPLSSAYITKSESPNIMLGKSPERDREIDNICQMIRNASQAGIRLLKYNMSILGVVRTESTTGRGGAIYSTFNYEKAADRAQLTEAGPVSAEEAWERIGYFVKRVMPVAEEHKVRLACHPHDPAMPEPQGFRGVHRVLGSVDGLKRFIALTPSPSHGLNFCQGTVSEMLKNPGEEIYDVIRYFGSRGKIFNVHFRNIKGGFLNFQETFPDNGDVDFIRAIRTYKEVGYDGLLMPDHVPQIAGDAGGRQAFAYCFGYIQALIQMVNQEG